MHKIGEVWKNPRPFGVNQKWLVKMPGGVLGCGTKGRAELFAASLEPGFKLPGSDS